MYSYVMAIMCSQMNFNGENVAGKRRQQGKNNWNEWAEDEIEWKSFVCNFWELSKSRSEFNENRFLELFKVNFLLNRIASIK